MINKTYALITAAYNEEKNIEKTITAVCCQTFLPKKWIIISDGSTDSTDKIVQHYAKKYEFIIFLRLGNDQNRNFSKKVNALTVGYNQIKDIQFDFLGILDADISFDAKYYENIILKFRANTRLGISGGVIFSVSYEYLISLGLIAQPLVFFHRLSAVHLLLGLGDR